MQLDPPATEPPDTTGAVFLSYASQDAEAAARICEALRAGGIEVWFDRSDLRGGDAWDSKIKKQIHDCALFVPLISANTNARAEGYFRREWNLATRRLLDMAQDAPFLVPVVIDATREDHARVPEEFLHVQWTRMPGGDAQPAFVHRVRQLLGGGGIAESSATSAVPWATQPGGHNSLEKRPVSPRRQVGYVLAALLLAGGAGLWYYQRSSDSSDAGEVPAANPANVTRGDTVRPVPPTADPRPSIAVLPFENRSDEPKDAHFAGGMHDDILMQLTKIGALRVIARTSVEQFRDTRLSTKEIGGKLGVTTILEGGVQRAGDRVRVTVQLIDASTDTHLWAESYDRDLTAENLFAIQTEVAKAIADELKATLTPVERRRVDSIPTKNLEAWEAYQLARQRLAKRTTASLMDAEKFAQKAISLDPRFALAYSALAETLALQIAYANMPERATNERAQAAVEQALKLDSNLSEAWAISGLIAETRQQIELAEHLYSRAIELNPNNAMALTWHGSLVLGSGRIAEGRKSLERAAGVDPLSAIIRLNLAGALESQAQFGEAATQLLRAIEIDPSMPGAYASLGKLKAYAFNRFAEAIPLVRTAVDLDPDNPNWLVDLAVLHIELEDDARASELLGRVATRWPENVNAPFWLAVIDLTRRDYAGADRYFRRSLELWPTSNFGALWGLRDVDLHNNRCEVALDRYRTAYPQLVAASDPRVDLTNHFVAIDVSLLLQKCGDAARADKLLVGAEQVIKKFPRLGSYGYYFRDVQIHALRGDKAKALTTLRKAKNSGWRFAWRYLPIDPSLATIREEPEFKAIYAEISRDMAKQRAELEARPDNAPLDLSPT